MKAELQCSEALGQRSIGQSALSRDEQPLAQRPRPSLRFGIAGDRELHFERRRRRRKPERPAYEAGCEAAAAVKLEPTGGHVICQV
jgi:hypothetical protein